METNKQQMKCNVIFRNWNESNLMFSRLETFCYVELLEPCVRLSSPTLKVNFILKSFFNPIWAEFDHLKALSKFDGNMAWNYNLQSIYCNSDIWREKRSMFGLKITTNFWKLFSLNEQLEVRSVDLSIEINCELLFLIMKIIVIINSLAVIKKWL
jgi:hypothetical protein